MEAFKNSIIFKFSEEIIGGRFVSTHHAGIILTSEIINQADIPRWGQVIQVGPDCTDVVKDDYILIDKGKWTTGFEINGERFWKTDEDQILGIAEDAGTSF